jgi:hypothetical protein
MAVLASGLRSATTTGAVFWVGAAAPLLVALLMAWVLPESQRFESVRNRGMTGQGSYLALLGANQLLTTILLWITACLTLLVIYRCSTGCPPCCWDQLRAEQVSDHNWRWASAVIGAPPAVHDDSCWRALPGNCLCNSSLLLFCWQTLLRRSPDFRAGPADGRHHAGTPPSCSSLHRFVMKPRIAAPVLAHRSLPAASAPLPDPSWLAA